MLYVQLNGLWLLGTVWMSDVHHILSSRPCSAPVGSFVESIHLVFGLRLFLLPSIFCSIIVFPKELCLFMMFSKWDSLFYHFCLQRCFIYWIIIYLGIFYNKSNLRDTKINKKPFVFKEITTELGRQMRPIQQLTVKQSTSLTVKIEVQTTNYEDEEGFGPWTFLIHGVFWFRIPYWDASVRQDKSQGLGGSS